MKIKIGDNWYTANKDRPIMVVLSPQDKLNIRGMHQSADSYAIFGEASTLTKDQKYEWMREGRDDTSTPPEPPKGR